MSQLIRETVNNFNVGPDKNAISRLRGSISTLQELRELRIADAENALKRLARTESQLRSQHSESVSTHSATTHANTILALDTQKFRVAKAASDLEAEGERLEAELEALKARLQDLEMQGVEGDEIARERREAEDPSVLKLKVFRSLGMDLEADGKTGQKKAVIRSHKAAGAGKGKGDVHVVTVDPGSAKSYYADYFWDVL